MDRTVIIPCCRKVKILDCDTSVLQLFAYGILERNVGDVNLGTDGQSVDRQMFRIVFGNSMIW